MKIYEKNDEIRELFCYCFILLLYKEKKLRKIETHFKVQIEAGREGMPILDLVSKKMICGYKKTLSGKRLKDTTVNQACLSFFLKEGLL